MITRIKHSYFLATAAVTIFVTILILSGSNSKNQSDLDYGVSFSPSYAQFLGLDWKKTYIEILHELKVKKLRLSTFWQEVEPDDGRFNFTDIDFMLEEAKKSEAKVLLVVGVKQPRWPECQIPKWATKLSVQDRQKKTLEMLETVISKYRGYSQIWGWQVENEPLFQFGENCDPPNRKFLKEEVELVKRLDPTRPIVISDTGEWRPWVTPMKLSDILGISLYRKAHNPILGNYSYPFFPSMYSLKSFLVRNFLAPQNLKTIVTELQGEPWSEEPLPQTSISRQVELFSEQNLKENVAFTRKTGFDEVYLWGVEWWYFMKEQGYPKYWEYAKELFTPKTS